MLTANNTTTKASRCIDLHKWKGMYCVSRRKTCRERKFQKGSEWFKATEIAKVLKNSPRSTRRVLAQNQLTGVVSWSLMKVFLLPRAAVWLYLPKGDDVSTWNSVTGKLAFQLQTSKSAPRWRSTTTSCFATTKSKDFWTIGNEIEFLRLVIAKHKKPWKSLVSCKVPQATFR